MKFDDAKMKLVIGLIEYYIHTNICYGCKHMEHRDENYRKPKIGDWVFEFSTLSLRGKWVNIGKLISIKNRKYKGMFGNNKVYRIKTLEGKLVNWENCTFWKLPKEVSDILNANTKTIYFYP